MVIAFVAGMVFTAVLAQTLLAADNAFPGLKRAPIMPRTSGDHGINAPFPAPDYGSPAHKNIYGLVHACPGREAMLSG